MNDLKTIAKEVRKNILKMCYTAKSSHIGSALSCTDILVALYFEVLNVDPANFSFSGRDRFILSKGHACSALYSVLAEKKFFNREVLATYCMNGGSLFGHSTKNINGIECSTGSLGHGLPIGVGMSLAGKNLFKVFVLLSDGECDEGSNWEAILFAAHHKLDNLTVIVDYNKLQALGKTNEVINLEPFKDKWESFGWAVYEIDGHDFEQIINSLNKFNKGKPKVIIANTIKGKGISFMENKLEWHYKSPNEDEFNKALLELE